MRSALILAILIGCSAQHPAERHFVHDDEGVLEVEEEIRFDSLFQAHEARTGNEIALVTHATFNGRSSRDFAVAFGDSIGVGKGDRNNGVTIAFSKAKRQVFIATGYGTEKVLHDSICQRIIDNAMLPRFKTDDAAGGLWAGSAAIVEFLDRPENRIP